MPYLPPLPAFVLTICSSATGTGAIAKYTGAANVNAASFVLAGAAAVAAVVIA